MCYSGEDTRVEALGADLTGSRPRGNADASIGVLNLEERVAFAEFLRRGADRDESRQQYTMNGNNVGLAGDLNRGTVNASIAPL